ncbi:interleukin-27 subunit beta [Sphaerodactylus townsendi]|uniref:interleukin-27 subunit beta n=1 Tax=Sphaerodactylus townsendi TaxID=933632 RepID=UPI002026822C|nr:interleukin-27 subunit beta [Sphaerodactylus townsendi]XP_048351721.1 interleukin-27 subunit beta [Sphaerodactylus townsendi]
MHWILMLTLLLSTCSASDEDPTWLKKEEGLVVQQYANLGLAEVLLRCPVPEGAPTVEWRVNGTAGPIWKASVREDSSLTLWNTSLAQEAEYSCHDPTTGRVLHRVYLKLGYPPKKPSIQCSTTSYGSPVNCTWKLEKETHLDTSFITTYRDGMDREVRDCVQSSTGADSCSIADVQLFSIIPYVLNVTAVNPLGTRTNIFPFLLNQIIKPDPPEDLKVSAIAGMSWKLRLEWKPPSSWLFPEYFPLKYVIRYSRNGTDSHKTTRPLEQTSFVLTGVRPGATYHIQVAAKDCLDNGEYSAWSSPASGTAWRPA